MSILDIKKDGYAVYIYSIEPLYRIDVEWGFRDMELSGFEPLTPCMPCKTDTLKLPGFGHFHALQDWHAKKDANLLLSLQKTQKKSAQNIWACISKKCSSCS
jgi:hypothetical protein